VRRPIWQVNDETVSDDQDATVAYITELAGIVRGPSPGVSEPRLAVVRHLYPSKPTDDPNVADRAGDVARPNRAELGVGAIAWNGALVDSAAGQQPGMFLAIIHGSTSQETAVIFTPGNERPASST